MQNFFFIKYIEQKASKEANRPEISKTHFKFCMSFV